MDNDILAKFRAYDTDHTGRITLPEFRHAFSAMGATEDQILQTFYAVDTNGDGGIDYNEFVRWLYSDTNSTTQVPGLQPAQGHLDKSEVQGVLKRISAALERTKVQPTDFFQKLDLDGNGFISRAELDRMVQQFEPNISASALHDTFREFDCDGNGWVDYREFCAALQRASNNPPSNVSLQPVGYDLHHQELCQSILVLRKKIEDMDETAYLQYCLGKPPPPPPKREAIIPRRHWIDDPTDIHKLGVPALEIEKSNLENFFHHMKTQVESFVPPPMQANAPAPQPQVPIHQPQVQIMCSFPGCTNPTFNGQPGFCSVDHMQQATQAGIVPQALPLNGHPENQADLIDPKTYIFTMEDPRNKMSKVGVVAFLYQDKVEQCDKICGSAFLGNSWDLGADGLQLAGSRVFNTVPNAHTITETKAFRNATAAFQALKFWEHADHFRSLSGEQSFQFKKQLQGREDWKYSGYGSNWLGMLAVLRAKFSQNTLCADALLKTGDAYLLNHQTNANEDMLWSDNNVGNGMNWLGMLLMLIRDEIRMKTGAQPMWSNYIQNNCGVNMETGNITHSVLQDMWPNTVNNATKAFMQKGIDKEMCNVAAGNQYLGPGNSDYGLLWNYTYFNKMSGPVDESHRHKIRNDTKAKVVGELGLWQFGDSARCARKWPPNCQETKLFLDQSAAAAMGAAPASADNLLGRYDMVSVRVNTDYDRNWAPIHGVNRSFWVVHAAALNVGESARPPDFPDFQLNNVYNAGLDEDRYLAATQRIFDNLMTVCVTLHAVHLILFPFGMGAFLRNLPLLDPRHNNPQVNCNFRCQIVMRLMQALLRSESFLNIHICISTGSEEEKRNSDAFIRALMQADPSLKQRMTLWPDCDCLQLAHDLAGHSQHVLLLNGANRQLLGNHWFEDRAKRAIDENLHRRSWTMSALSYLINNYGVRRSALDWRPGQLKENVEWLGGQAFYMN